jgi:uncharacterized protein (TIGR02246 family)
MFRNMFILAGCSVILFAAGCGTALAAEPEKDGEEKAIRSLIAGMAEAWKKHDVKSYMSRFTDDGDVVSRFGQRHKGRDKATEQFNELHKSAFRDRLAERVSTVESVRFITSDVALVHERCKESEGESMWTYVVSKKEGEWKVESFTVVMIKAAPPSPKR